MRRLTRPLLWLSLFTVTATVIFTTNLTGGTITLPSARLDAQEVSAATPAEVTADEVNVVARELWCPLCNGVRLDACELQACAQMRDVIAIKLGEGESTESIQNYFIDQYGPQVLGRPPFEGFNWLAWVLPPLVLLAGGALVVMRIRSMVRPAEADALAEMEQAALSGDQTAPADMYAARLEEELKNHE